MKLSACMTVEIEVSDYREAAEFQLSMGAELERVREVYPSATLELRERRLRSDAWRGGDRARKGDAGRVGERRPVPTGMVHIYEDS